MQTKFSALVPAILSGDMKEQDETEYFWHSFFLLKPEFVVLQSSLYKNYSIQSLRRLITKSLEAIKSNQGGKVAALRRKNASYFLVQCFESIWPRIRAGTFGIDAISILCGLQNADIFFSDLFRTLFAQTDYESCLVLISLLVATRDIETNALTDYFISHCDETIQYCLQASDIYILLFSLLLHLERPNGPFVARF